MFTDEHEMFRKTVRDFVVKEVDPYTEEWEQDSPFPAREVFKKLGDLGLLGLEYDEKWGGGGADHMYKAIFGEEIGRMDSLGIAMAIAVQTDMATPSLAMFGSDELKAEFLVPAIAGDAITAIGVTEPDAGSDVAGLRTTARRDGDDWIISGTKLYITNGLQADWVCVLARTSDEGGHRGISQIVVPTNVEGYSISRKLDKLGMRASDTVEMVFEDVRVPVSYTIGEIGQGFQQQMKQFQHERMIAAYEMVGAMNRAIDRTAEYLNDREAFGKPLSANQYLVYELADLRSEVEVLRYFNYAAAEAYMDGEDITRFATIAKLRAGRLIREVADKCLQFHGGVGYMEETWTARFFRDSRLWSIGGGADEVMLRTLARMDGMV